MRVLSTEEKEFIKELVRISQNSHNVFLANIIDRELNNVDIYLDYSNNLVEYRFDKILYDKDPDEFMFFARDFSWKIMRYVNLLKDLEKVGMLFLYQESPNRGNSRFGRLINNNPFIKSDLNDINAINSIIEYSKKTILINESLVKYVNDGFKTEEDLKHIESIKYSEKNLKVANESLESSLTSLEIANKSLTSSNKSLKYAGWTLIATIVIFIIGMIINVIIVNKEKEPLKINENQINSINESIQNNNKTQTNQFKLIENRLIQIDSSTNLIKSKIK